MYITFYILAYSLLFSRIRYYFNNVFRRAVLMNNVLFCPAGVGIGSRLRRQFNGELHSVRKQWTVFHQVGNRRYMSVQTAGLRNSETVRVSGGGD